VISVRVCDCYFGNSIASESGVLKTEHLSTLYINTSNMTTSFKDRTNEFHSMCGRIRIRANTPSSILERRALLSSPEPSQASLNNKKKTPHARSEFSMMAAEISRQITNTAAKLEKLTRCKLVLKFPVYKSY
jgi:hypothetical protein